MNSFKALMSDSKEERVWRAKRQNSWSGVQSSSWQLPLIIMHVFKLLFDVRSDASGATAIAVVAAINWQNNLTSMHRRAFK